MARVQGLRDGSGNFPSFVPSCRRNLQTEQCSLASPLLSTVLPLLWETCLIQKQAVRRVQQTEHAEMLRPRSLRGSLMTGALLLNTFPPRSKTKWLCVATNANAIESGTERDHEGNWW